MTTNEPLTCPDCGTLLPADSPQQLCPSCLLKQAFASRTIDQAPAELSPPPTPEDIADKFPQFEITECLGRGGMGVVYKARQKSLNRWVAIKVLAPERIHDEKFAERFTREAQTLAQLNHPNIVTVHDYGETDGLFYIVMEFVDGVNLRDLLRDGKIESTQALTIVPPICEALQYAHDKGIVHRDIKPENLLIDRNGRVKIADFGIASLIGDTDEKSGTPPYMAPEQGNHGNVDHRADIYALGAVLYEMLTGDRPASPLDLPSQKVQLDIRIDDIVLRALSKEPERRYRTANEFRTVVENITPEKAPAAIKSSIAPNPKAPQTKRGMVSRFWWIFLVMIPVGILLGLAVGLICYKFAPKKYEAHSIVQVPFNDSSSATATWIEVVMARKTMLGVIEILDLKQRWNLPEHEAVTILKSMISTQSLRGTDLIEIKARGKNPSEVTDIANTTAQVFQTRVSSNSKMAGKVIIHEVALEPSIPVSPNRTLNLIVFSYLGFFLSPLLSWALMAILHRRIPDPSPPIAAPELTEEQKAKTAYYGKIAFWLFLAGTLGTLAMMTLSSNHLMALIFGGVALLLSLVFGLMSKKRGVVIALIVIVLLAAVLTVLSAVLFYFRMNSAQSMAQADKQRAMQIAEEAAQARQTQLETSQSSSSSPTITREIEPTALKFLRAVSTADVDGAHALLSESAFPTLFPKLSDEDRKGLQRDFEDICETYHADPDRMRHISKWHQNADHAIGRVMPPDGKDDKSLYLILKLGPKGWRVAHIGEIGSDEQLAGTLDEWLANR